ncbi:MAG: molybdopterin molybdotransferase MoeA [Acidobacteriales bacterium]|nr:molybdopterin molybdotransferase MoeA [Terriglobales bacterium]
MPDFSPALSFEEARHLVETHAAGLHSRGKELIPLLSSPGRILGETITADRDFPPFPRATRDGFAVRASDLAVLPASLRIIAEIKAGAQLDPTLQVRDGEAVAIMTGAAVPPGSDAVVMVEYTRTEQDRVEVRKSVAFGDNVVPQGAEAKRGDVLLSPGLRVDYPAIAVAASVGRERLLVARKPVIAVLATGDEIVDLSVLPGPHQIRNSNSFSLASQILSAGGEPLILPVAPDKSDRLRELIQDGFEADLLLLSGGVSMGKYDLVEQVLAELDAEFFFTGVEIQPGRPLVFGKAGSKYFFGLPGNPISTMVTFELFVRPVLQALAGAQPSKLIFTSAQLRSPVKTKTGLKRFLPALLSGEFECARVELLPWQGSGDIAALVRANCFLVVPPDRDEIPAGEWVPVVLR